MSEEVIIEGINVAECALFNDGKCRNLTSLVQGEYSSCKSMCDYGAYARKEQILRLQAENDLIKRLLNDILQIFNLGQYDFLKDQNEIIMALKKAVQKDKDFFEFVELKQENTTAGEG